MVGVAVIVIVLIVVPDHHQSVGYVFGGQANATGYGHNVTGFHHAAFWLVFGLGFLMAQYTITGFDASAHMSEETHQASRMAAVGMYMSVVVSVIFGFVLLVAVTFAVPSTQGALDNIGAVVPWIWSTSMSQNWSDALPDDLRGRAVLLPDCVDDVGVADDVRVLARRGRARATRSGGASPSAACPSTQCSRSASSPAC